MARINIEESLWTDPKQRFTKFCIKLGDEVKALGYVVQAWRMAQAHWCPDRKPIPDAEWKAAGMPNEMIEAGLAERRGGGVYLKGSEEQFAWWFQKRAAGIASGKARGGGNESSTPDDQGSTPVNGRSTNDDGREPLSSSLFSLSSSLSAPPSDSLLGRASEKSDAPKSDHRVRDFIAAYCDAFRARYETGPPISSKTAGIAKRIVKDLGLPRSKLLVEAFLAMEDSFFLLKRHDLVTFEQNLNAVSVKLDTGNSVSSRQARDAELYSTNVQVMRDYLQKKGATP